MIRTVVTEVDLSGKELGEKCAVEAVCAMLKWNAATISVLNLR
jgi:hypothetical protein